MIDKYEAHNQRVLAASIHGPSGSMVVISEHFYDVYEEAGNLNLLDNCVVSRPLTALVRYPPKYVRQGYIGKIHKHKKYKFKLKK
jgi:hypothetical protein